MKLNVNTNVIKKGMFLAGLSLMCVSASGCTKKEQAENVSVVVDQKDDDNKLKVAEAPETLEILDAYTFSIAKVWGEKEKEKIIEKYGKDTFKCVQEYGLPVAMYSYKSFGAEDVKLEYKKEKTK